jgi:hypothetical protein
MTIVDTLNERENSFLLFIPGADSRILIAAPHHAPLGVQQLPCPTHVSSDENTGWIAYHLAQRLKTDCLIAGNYFLDSNKYKSSDYYKKIEELRPKVLVEIHGHGGHSAHYDIEISAGSRAKSEYSQKMASLLLNAFVSHPFLQGLSISGDFDEIYFRATRSLTINTHEWLAFHLELPQTLRESEAYSLAFCEGLAAVVGEFYLA